MQHHRDEGRCESRRFTMNLGQLFRCAFGHHVRSHRRSYLEDGRKVSVCRCCGRRMVKEDLAWKLLSAEGVATSASPPDA